MAKRNFFDRMVQKVDQSFNRNEKSDVLAGEFEGLSQLCQTMQDVCHTLAREIKECIPNSLNEPAKRLKKTKSWALAQTLKECGRDNFDNRNSFGFLLQFSGDTEECLAKEQIHYEAKVEENVLSQLSALEADFKAVAKSRKNLQKLCADMDSAKKKYEGLARQSTISTSESNATKITHAKAEYEDLFRQVDTQRDQLSVELLSMAPRQSEAAEVLIKHIELKKEYHQQALRIFESIDPALQLLKEKMVRPLFGTNLREELDRRGAEIALVLDICCTYLYHCSLKEEGLFRIAGSSSRVKFLKAAFDAQLPMISSNGSEQYQVVSLLTNDMDHHAISSLLKTYLRELPDALPTSALYDEWMDTTRIANIDERKRALSSVIEKLPDENYTNLNFLIQFLAGVASHSEENKMTTANLAIVIAPSLFTCGSNEKIQFDMAATSSANTIVETLIAFQDEFFPGDFQPSQNFPVTPNSFTYSEFEHLPTLIEPERIDLPGQSAKQDTTVNTLPVTPTPPIDVPFKTKKAPPPPSITKRVATAEPTPPKTLPEDSTRSSPPPPIAVPEDISSSTPKPRLYPDMTSIAASYGPTILPVAYSPPKHPSAPVVEEENTNGIVAPSPVPVPRSKSKPAVPPHNHHTRAASADISSNKFAMNKNINPAEKSETKFPFEKPPDKSESLIQKSIERLQINDASRSKPIPVHLGAIKASPGKPPTPPPRTVHENTYL